MTLKDSLKDLCTATEVLDNVYNQQFYFNHNISMRALDISIEVKKLIHEIMKKQ